MGRGGGIRSSRKRSERRLLATLVGAMAPTMPPKSEGPVDNRDDGGGSPEHTPWISALVAG